MMGCYSDCFTFPEVEKNYEKNLQNREQIAAVSYELDKEKHILRQMQGLVHHFF